MTTATMLQNTPSQFLQIPDGAAGTRETLKLMRDLVRAAKRDPDLRVRALRLVDRVREKDWHGEIRAVFAFVQKKIRYTLDINQIETLQPPAVTLALGHGDCDDKTMLVVTLLELLGHPCYLCAIGFDAPDQYAHVFALVDPGGEGDVMALDATEPFPMGWGPPGGVCVMLAPIEE